MLPVPFFLLPVHPGGLNPTFAGLIWVFWCHLSGGHVAFSCHAPFFILLPRNPVIPGQLLLMRRGNEQRLFLGRREQK